MLNSETLVAPTFIHPFTLEDIFDRDRVFQPDVHVMGLVATIFAILTILALHYKVSLKTPQFWDMLCALQIIAMILFHCRIQDMQYFLLCTFALTAMTFMVIRFQPYPCVMGWGVLFTIIIGLVAFFYKQNFYLVVYVVALAYVTTVITYYEYEIDQIKDSFTIWPQLAILAVFLIHIICYFTQDSGYESVLQVIWVPGFTYASYISLHYAICIEDYMYEQSSKKIKEQSETLLQKKDQNA